MSQKPTRAKAPGIACRLAVCVALVASLAAPAYASRAQAATPAHESGKTITLSERLGFDPDQFVANLEAHADKYLGTPYTMSDREAGPGSGMDCSSFVSYALINEAGVADSFLRHDMAPRHADDNCLPNTETFFDWAFSNVAVKVYSSKADLLASSPKKGDILFVWGKDAGDTPVGGGASHVGFYWGDEDGEDLFFHAISERCKIGPIEGKVAGDLYYASVEVSHGYDLTVDKSQGTAIDLETSGNGEYAAILAGAVYGVFSDAACTDEVAAITIEKDGDSYTGTAEGLDAGTYWVKETSAPKGYALDAAVRKVVLDGDSTVKSSEDKQYAALDIAVTKIARDGRDAPEGDSSFAGARFKIDYPNGKSGVYQADASGKVPMDVDGGALVSGDAMDVVDGRYALQLGTYTVTEIEAPAGCVVPENASRTFTVAPTDQKSATSTKVTFENEADGSLGYEQTPALGGLVIAKGDAELFDEGDTGGDGAYYNYAQGDASLAGAEFTVYNESAGRVCADVDDDGRISDGEVFAPGAAILTIATEHDPDLDAYVARTAADLLPYGSYRVVETKAPEGYTQEGAVEKTFAIRSDGQVCEFMHADGELNEVVLGGVQVVKSDRELGASEALGGNAHDALATGATLSGIEFTIANASAHGVMVDGAWHRAGDEVMTITTSWNEDARAYTAQTDGCVLPHGTYTIRETATNGSYLLTDGEPRTFQVRENGVVVGVDAAGGALEFFDQVVRNDLEITKKSESSNDGLQVPFLITNVTTGEAHVVVTDRNGDVSTASSWNAHSSNTNANDALLGLDEIGADDMDAAAGVWFALGEDGSSAEVDDGLAALPFGEYTLAELPCDANEGYALIEKTFWIERDSTAAKAVWMSLDDQDGPRIGTTATDAADGDKELSCEGEVTIADTVAYENLDTSKTYTLVGTLVDKATGVALADAEGNEITSSVEFVPALSTGSVRVDFTFDASRLPAGEVVAFESLRSEGVEVAAHADVDDEGQTVSLEPEIGTRAADAADGDQIVTAGEATIVDVVSYAGLVPGETYTMEGTLMDKSTGEAFEDAGGNAVTSSASFTAEASSGEVEVSFTFETAGLAEGGELVVFERCLDAEGGPVAVHEDMGSCEQTVVVDNPDTEEVPESPYPKTGADAPENRVGTAVAAALAALALAGGGAACYRRRRSGADADGVAVDGAGK